jgi:two-component system, sensor histidine kinase and response regulator
MSAHKNSLNPSSVRLSGRVLGRMLEEFSRATGLAVSVTLYPGGKEIARAGPDNLCSRYHLCRPDLAAQCELAREELLGVLGNHSGEMPVLQCGHGLAYGGVSVELGNGTVAVLRIGQVFLDPPCEKAGRAFAKEHGLDVGGYLTEMKRISVVPREKFEASLSLLKNLADIMLLEARTKAAERKTRAAEEHLAGVLGNIPGVAYRCGVERPWRADFISAGCEALTGYRPEEFYGPEGVTLEGLIHPEDLARVDEDVARSVREGKPYEIEYRLLHRGGRKVWVFERGMAHRSQCGKPVCLYGVYLDIGKLKDTETKFRNLSDTMAHEAAFRKALLETLPIGVFYKDADGRYTGCNAVFSEVTGIPAETLCGKHPRDLWPRDYSGVYEDKDAELLASGGVQIYQGRVLDASGNTREVLFSKRTFEDEAGRVTGLVGCSTDITDQIRREKELERAKAEAEAAVEAKAAFLAAMSHEIRTPLNGICGFSELLLHSGLDNNQYHLVESLQGAANSLLGTINDILDFSKLEAGRVAISHLAFPLEETVREAADLLTPRAEEKGISLEVGISPDVPARVVGDPMRLRQILLNLLGNAVKFTKHGGVTLRVEREDPPPTIRFSVSDTGIGISPADQLKLFKPFAQASAEISQKFGGTGLGLVICRQLAELMGGRIDLISREGKGSTFAVHLPLPANTTGSQVDQATPKRRTAPSPDSMAASHPLRILLVEDTPSNQVLTMAILKKLGYQPTLATDGKQALELIEKSPFDVVLMDLQMLPMDGITTTLAIRQILPPHQQPHIIAVSAHVFDHDRMRSKQVGMNAFLAKPFSMQELVELLEKSPRLSEAGPAPKNH